MLREPIAEVNGKPTCEKHGIPMQPTWWGGWICPACEEEEK